MRLKHAERADEDARGDLLADAAAVPALAQRPILERPFATDDMPDAGARGRRHAAQSLEREPHFLARFGLRQRDRRFAIALRQTCEIGHAQRIELRGHEERVEILAGLMHLGRDRLLAQHRAERIERAIRTRRPPFLIGDRMRCALDRAMRKTLSRRRDAVIAAAMDAGSATHARLSPLQRLMSRSEIHRASRSRAPPLLLRARSRRARGSARAAMARWFHAAGLALLRAPRSLRDRGSKAGDAPRNKASPPAAAHRNKARRPAPIPTRQ